MNDSNPLTPADARLARLLGGDRLASLRRRMRRHFERLDDDNGAGVLQLIKLNAAEHEALSLLTGRSSRMTQSMRIDIAQLNMLLRDAGIADSLRAALERLDGPIINQAKLKRERQARWCDLLQGEGGCPALRIWMQSAAGSSLLKRLTRLDIAVTEQLLARSDAVLRRLPVNGMTRSQLAAETLGNAHALDANQPVATVVLAAWHGYTRDAAGTPAIIPPDESVRGIWGRAGVLVNELARPSLFLNLPLSADAPSPEASGEPGYLSLRKLLRSPPAWAVAGQTIFVCENPNIVAIAADRLGMHCAPLVCTDGMPAAAQQVMLTQLIQAGAVLKYHGDFDWPGLQIGNYVMREWNALPWRFDACDYAAALAQAPERPQDLSDALVEAGWDAELALTMRTHGLAVAEEAVVDTLLADLAR